MRESRAAKADFKMLYIVCNRNSMLDIDSNETEKLLFKQREGKYNNERERRSNVKEKETWIYEDYHNFYSIQKYISLLMY